MVLISVVGIQNLFRRKNLKGSRTMAVSGQVSNAVIEPDVIVFHNLTHSFYGMASHGLEFMGMVVSCHTIAQGQPSLHLAVMADGKGGIVAAERGNELCA